MDNTITLQGNFVATGKRVDLSIPCGADWIRVYNLTALEQSTADLPFEFYWQKNMASGEGIAWVNQGAQVNNPVGVGGLVAGTGFVPLNQGYNSGISSQVRDSIRLSAPVAFTAVSNATQPVVTTGNTAGLQEGDVVYLSQTSGAIDANDLLGIPFEIDNIVANTSFRIKNVLEQAPGNAGTNGFWRRVVVGNTFYPELRYIVNIDTAGNVFGTMTSSVLQPVIVTSVDSGYQVGQEVTFHVSSSLNGMVEIDALSAPIIAVDPDFPSAFQVSLDTTGFTAFTFPLNADLALINNAYTPAHVVPAGEDTATALAAIPVANILSDASKNQLIIGMTLLGGNTTPGGIAGPAGSSGDVMFWQAGAVYSTNGM